MKESFGVVPEGDREGGLRKAAVIESRRSENLHQMSLVLELYERDHPSAVMAPHDRDFNNAAASYWIENGYANSFRKFLTHPGFKEHPRLRGDPCAVTLSDMEYFQGEGNLPN